MARKDRNTIRKIKNMMVAKFDTSVDVPEDTIIQMMQAHGVDFDAESAKRQWWKKQASSFIASVKDKKGVRKIFATKDVDGNTVFVHVEKVKQSKPLTKTREQFDKKINGFKKTRKKLRRFEDKAITSEQITLFTAMEAENKKNQNK